MLKIALFLTVFEIMDIFDFCQNSRCQPEFEKGKNFSEAENEGSIVTSPKLIKLLDIISRVYNTQRVQNLFSKSLYL